MSEYKEGDVIALALVNAERAEHMLPPCTLADLMGACRDRYRARAYAVIAALDTQARKGE